MPLPDNHCYKCGNVDHTTSQCSFKHRVCFQCHEPGHNSKVCPLRYRDRTCGGCGKKGHISQGCPDRESWVCKNCTQPGHGHWECTKPKGYRHKRCHLCHSLGHVALNCDNRPELKQENAAGSPSHTRDGKRQKQKCVLCWGDHVSLECFLVPCVICGIHGHKSSACCENFDQRMAPPPDSPRPRAFQKAIGIKIPHSLSLSTILRCNKCGSHQHDSPSCKIIRDETNWQMFGTNHTGANSQVSSQQTHRERTRLWEAADYELCDDIDDRALALLMEAMALERHGSEHPALPSTQPADMPQGCHLLSGARCDFLLGSTSSALLAWDNALSMNGADEDALSLRRRIVELDGNMETYTGVVSRDRWCLARSAYNSCLSAYAQERSNSPTQRRCWDIELLIAEGKMEEAIQTVDTWLRETSDDINAMSLRALALFLDAKPLEALDQLATALKLDPNNGRAKALQDRIKEVVLLKRNGDEAFQRNEYQTAIASWTDALMTLGEREIEGRGGNLRAVLLLDRATGLRKVRKFAESLKDINESLQVRPAHSKAFLCRARIMVDLEQFETAADDFRATLKDGKASLNGADKREIEAELEVVERRAKLQKLKEQDHYATLGLAASCTTIEIKKAYHTLSMKHHPDRGGVAEKFSEIAHAYAVLSDSDQKRAYDAKLQSPSPGPSTQPTQYGCWWESHFRQGPDLRTGF